MERVNGLWINDEGTDASGGGQMLAHNYFYGTPMTKAIKASYPQSRLDIHLIRTLHFISRE
jgi:hypothetical protein